MAVSKGRESDVIGDPAVRDMLVAGGASAYLSGHHQASYPSQSGGVLQISQACLIDGARKYLDTGQTAAKAFGLLDIAPSRQIDEHALAAPEFAGAIILSSLPAVLPSDQGRILRCDIDL